MHAYTAQFLLALAATVAIETTVLFLFVRRIFKLGEKKLPTETLIFYGYIASFATIPYLWFVVPSVFQMASLPALSRELLVLGMEVIVSIIETFIYRFGLKLGMKRALIVSFACNAASFLIGRIVTALL